MSGMPCRECATVGMAGFCQHREWDAALRAVKRDRETARLRSIGHLAFAVLWAIVGVVVFMSAGCAPTFAHSRETCLGKVDSPKEAAALIVPHLANAMVCASQNIEDDAAALVCVEREFAALRTEVTPVVFSCAMTLVEDAVAARRK